MLSGKKILIGITGSIAAYKTASLIRLLKKEGVELRVVMTPCASEFITPLTISALSCYPVISDNFDRTSGLWHSHIDYGSWADMMIIVPATANTIGKMANGICDNFLIACYLAARCPVFIAPAMDVDMLNHHTTQKNIKYLSENGVNIISPTEGELASGLYGSGRMEEPENILTVIRNFFSTTNELTGKTALVTAGPTYEAIDPVRYIGNHSSGKMGFAIAEELLLKGAKVELITGPVNIDLKHNNLNITRITSASQMFDSVKKKSKKSDIIVMAAAVADYTPSVKSDNKIKKQDKEISLQLKQTTDILDFLGKHKNKGQILVGFALETDNKSDNALKKLHSKNLDFIVLNSPGKDTGFGSDTNKITIISDNKKPQTFDLKSKREVASNIVNKIISIVHE